MIPVLTLAPVALPNPALLGAPLEVAIIPPATGLGVVVISGAAVAGGVATFGDLNGMIAYNGRLGHDTRGGTRGALRHARGNSDTKGRRVR